MPKTIRQKLVFKNTTPSVLYDFYMNAKKHAAITASEVKITSKEGTKFTAYDNYISGKNLQLIKDRLIVQSWRAIDWNEDAADSTFIILMEAKGNNVELTITHANVPDNEYESLDKGWHEHYWDLWKKQLG